MCLLSIIVPVYNVEKYIDKCLYSLVNQTLSDIEIIIVNDGSTDDSQKIIDKYVKNYSRKVFGYKKENGGLSDSRNFGLKHAKGEYVGFVDSDDWVEIDMFEKLYNFSKKTNADIVISDFIFEPENIVMHSTIQKNIKLNLKDNPEILFIEPSVCNKLFKRSLFYENDITFPYGLLHEDRYTIAQLYFYSDKIYYIGKGYYHYLKQRECSITTSINIKKFTDIMVILDKIEQFFKQKKCKIDIMNAYEILTLNLYISFSIRSIIEFNDIKKRNLYLEEFRDFVELRFKNQHLNNMKNMGFKKGLIIFLLKNRCYNILRILINIRR